MAICSQILLCFSRTLDILPNWRWQRTKICPSVRLSVFISMDQKSVRLSEGIFTDGWTLSSVRKNELVWTDSQKWSNLSVRCHLYLELRFPGESPEQNSAGIPPHFTLVSKSKVIIEKFLPFQIVFNHFDKIKSRIAHFMCECMAINLAERIATKSPESHKTANVHSETHVNVQCKGVWRLVSRASGYHKLPSKQINRRQRGCIVCIGM